MNGNLLFLDALRCPVVTPWFACPFHQGLDGKKVLHGEVFLINKKVVLLFSNLRCTCLLCYELT